MYFWSLVITAIAVFIAALFNLLVSFELPEPNWGVVSIAVISWWFYAPGQSLILWSRLHLVLDRPKILRGTLWAIIISAIAFIPPTTVLVFLQTPSDASPAYSHGYYIMESIQVTGYFLQEVFLAGLYIHSCSRLLAVVVEPHKRTILYQVFAINVAIIVMDCSIVVLQYLHHREVQVMIKTLIYSIKLELELVVLSKMVDFVTVAQPPSPNTSIWVTSEFGTSHGLTTASCTSPHQRLFPASNGTR